MRPRNLAAAALLTLVAACSVQTVGATGGDFTLVATFDNVQNLVEGHHVQMADVRVGSVTGIELEGYKAKVTMSIENGRTLPEGTDAQVAATSLLGENYIRLVPPASGGGPPLKDGARITKTSVQPDVEMLTEKAGPLINAVAGQDLTAIVDAGKTAFGDKGPQLNRMTEKTAKITGEYKKSIQDLNSVIDGFSKINSSLADGADEIDKLPSNLNRTAKGLTREGKRMKGGVAELTKLAKTINANVKDRHTRRTTQLIKRLRPVISSTLRGKEDLKEVTNDLVRFMTTPRVTKNQTTLLYVWLAGFLEAGGSSSQEGGNESKGKKPPLPGLPDIGDDAGGGDKKTPDQPTDDLFELLPGPQ